MAIRNLVSFQRPSVNSFRYNEEYSHGCRNEIRRRIHLANAHPPARFGQLLCNPVNYRRWLWRGVAFDSKTMQIRFERFEKNFTTKFKNVKLSRIIENKWTCPSKIMEHFVHAFLLNPWKGVIAWRKDSLWREACRPLSDQGSPTTDSNPVLSFFLDSLAMRPKSNEGLCWTKAQQLW